MQVFAFRSTKRSLAGRLRLLASPRVRLACLRLAAAACLHAVPLRACTQLIACFCSAPRPCTGPRLRPLHLALAPRHGFIIYIMHPRADALALAFALALACSHAPPPSPSSSHAPSPSPSPSPHAIYIMHPRRCLRPRICALSPSAAAHPRMRPRPRPLMCSLVLALALYSPSPSHMRSRPRPRPAPPFCAATIVTPHGTNVFLPPREGSACATDPNKNACPASEGEKKRLHGWRCGGFFSSGRFSRA